MANQRAMETVNAYRMKPFGPQELKAANVNPATGLATDYLNLFNEAIMLFEMGLDMPDMAGELAHWVPRGYVEHFERSGFEQKDVVIAAYRQAPASAREPFDALSVQALAVFAEATGLLLRGASREVLAARLEDMKALVAQMDAHIHGSGQTVLQGEVDALF